MGMLRSLIIYYGIPQRTGHLSAFYSEFIQPGDLCFDLGSHVGNHILALTRLGASVVAVEPHPRFFRLLRRLYRARSNVVLVPAAVGARSGKGTLMISRRTPTVSSTSAAWATAVRRAPSFARVRWEDSLPVDITTLDALIATYGRPKYCKIDVEGSELDVLNGLTQPVAHLSFEYIPVQSERAVRCIQRLLDLAEYRFNYSIGEHRRLRMPHWSSGQQMIEVMRAVPAGSPSGDIHARLV